MIAIFLTFLLSYSVFPGVMIEGGIGLFVDFPKNWEIITILLLFTAGDSVGRFLGGIKNYLSTKSIALDSAIFLGVFMVSTIFSSFNVSFFDDDKFKIPMLFLYGVASGYLSSCIMQMGPGCLEPVNKALGAKIMTVCLVSGLTAGTFVAAFVMRPLYG